MPRSFEHKPEESKNDSKPRKISDEEFEQYFGTGLDPALLNEKKEEESVGKKGPRNPAKEKPVQPPLNLEKVIITTHALERFKKRLRELNPGQNVRDPQGEILKLLSRSKEEGAIGSGMKVKRMMAHEYEQARYFHNEGWRFVVLEKEGQFVIKTIERKKPKR